MYLLFVGLSNTLFRKHCTLFLFVCIGVTSDIQLMIQLYDRKTFSRLYQSYRCVWENVTAGLSIWKIGVVNTWNRLAPL